MLTSEEGHEVSCDVAVGADDTALTGWSGRSGWTRGTLNRSHVRLPGTLNHIVLQQALIYRRDVVSKYFSDTHVVTQR